ncbi:MAG TPA: hypothetical protein PLS41_04045 [Bacteroidales bacterium]|nr:hypothetical protein [Bacteroidales bacterium]
MKNKLSVISIFIVIGVTVFMTFDFAVWKTKQGVIQSDVQGYYAYLPATFIFQDLQFSYMWDEENKEDIWGKIWFRETPEKVRFIQYTTGIAICYSPFFFISHVLAEPLGYKANGYTLPYALGIQFASIFYLFLGLVFLRKLLLKYFSDIVVSISIVVIVLGTNLAYYATREGPMSHLYSFTFITLFLWCLSQWLEKKRWRDAIFLGLVTGMVILIRPSNIFIILLFALWGITSFRDLLQRISFLLNKWYMVLVMIGFAFVVWIPQFLYWHEFSGQWFYNSYSGEGTFFWGDPAIGKILFSYRKGWLLYTPLMILSFLGLPLLYKKQRELFWPATTILVLAVYILGSWCFWWYGGSYGSRPFVDFYAVFAIPIAACVRFGFKKSWSAIATIIVLGFFIYHNFFQIEQYRNGALHYVSMTKEAYWDSFGRKHPSKEFKNHLEYPDYESVRARVAEKQNTN